jgi:hypothetical protein
MPNLITRTLVVPVWLLACALVVVSSAPSRMVATGILLFSSGLAAAAIRLSGTKAVHRPVLDGPPTIDVKPLSVASARRQLRQLFWASRSEPMSKPAAALTRTAVPRPEPSAVGPLSWPDSGFRNIARGTKGG